VLPIAARWGWLVVDATVFGALLPPALYDLLQKIFPTVMEYTGFSTLQSDARASSTVGYHPTFGMMCAMGTLLCASRVASFRANSLRYLPLRAVYSATGTLFLVALYFSFSRGAVVSLVGGVVVLLILLQRRFETLGNVVVSGLPALWVIAQARELPGLVARPVSFRAMEADGWALTGPLMRGLLFALIAQVVFSLIVWFVEGTVPEGVRRGARVAGGLAAVGVVVVGLGWGWATFQSAGGIAQVREEIQAETVTMDLDKLSQDQTERYTSLHAGDRILLWKIAWENWLRHPLSGTGGDTYAIVYEQEKPEGAGDSLYAHSIWMDLLSDTGIFAFLAFAAFSIGLLAMAAYNALYKKRSRRSQALIAGSAAAAAYLISSSVDWNWYIPASTLPFFALAAVAAGMTRRNRKQRPATTQ
jgi:O-antigen ligase